MILFEIITANEGGKKRNMSIKKLDDEKINELEHVVTCYKALALKLKASEKARTEIAHEKQITFNEFSIFSCEPEYEMILSILLSRECRLSQEQKEIEVSL